MNQARHVVRVDSRGGENFIHRNPLASALREPGFAFVETAAIPLRHRFVVGGRGGQSAGQWVGHDFQQAADCIELPGIELIQQNMCLAFPHVVILARRI